MVERYSFVRVWSRFERKLWTETSEVSVTANGQEQKFDYLLLAVPFDVLGRILPDTPSAAPLAAALGQFSTRRSPASISGSIAKSATLITPCCSTAPFSGCFINRGY